MGQAEEGMKAQLADDLLSEVTGIRRRSASVHELTLASQGFGPGWSWFLKALSKMSLPLARCEP
jgi:hypothetical protein